MKNLTWQNPEQLFVAQELINKVKSKCCGIKDKNFSFDLLDFIKQLNGGTIPATVENSLSQAVVAKNCLNGEEYPFVTLKIDATRYCGMGMYFPGRQIKSSWDKYCQSSVAWYNAAGWNEIQP